MKWIFLPIRLALWLGAIVIFWPVLCVALLIFNPEVMNWNSWAESQKQGFREFVLMKELRSNGRL